MSYLLNNQQKMNEIIFANRNKSYGAYAIRSSYGATLLKSLCLIFFGFGTIMYSAYYFSQRPDKPSQSVVIPPFQDDSVYTIPVDLRKQFEDPLPPEPQAQQNKQNSSSTIGTHVVDSSTAIVTKSVDIENPYQGSGNGTETLTGPVTGSGGEGTGTGSVNTSVTNVETIHVIADKEPEFEGGLKALYSFLGSKLKYPERASEIGKQGTVYVRFVVDQKGKVGNLTLQNSLGYGLDEEALRVVAMIPDFKNPGMVNGKAVKVYFQLPIKFSLQK